MAEKDNEIIEKSNEVLYRKHRPSTLEDVVGQNHIKKTLINAIKKNRIAHAYMFAGTRGTGKTTLARILAMMINCENGPSSTYDASTDRICQQIIRDCCPDVYEIDGAAEASVEKVRQIRQSASDVPILCRKKVFIIDEAHCLKSDAISALLKTLEEPPKTAMFILCTSEPHKIKSTILSRCQRFDFKRLTIAEISDYLTKICKLENVNSLSKNVISLIAGAAQGSVRDSLSILDAVIARCDGNEITDSEAEEIIGKSSLSFCHKLTGFILKRNTAMTIAMVRKAVILGQDPKNIFADLLEYIHDLLLGKIFNTDNHIYADETVKSKWRTQRDEADEKDLLFCSKFLNDSTSIFLTTPRPDLSLDVCLMEMLRNMKKSA